MTVLSDFPWTADSTSLNDYAHSIETVDGIDGIAAANVRSRRIPGTGGVWPIFEFTRGAKVFTLSMWAAPTNANGAVTHIEGSAGHVHDNLNALLDIFGKEDSAIALTREIPQAGGTNETLHADARVLRAFITKGSTYLRRFKVYLEIPYGYWLGSTLRSQTITGSNQYLSPTPTDVQHRNAILEFAAASTLTHVETSRTVQISGTPSGGYPVTVDLNLPRTVTDNGGNDADGLLTASHMTICSFAGATRFSKSGGNVTVKWYDHYR